MQPKQIDIQIQKILTSAKKLRQIAQDELAKKVLEINVNANSSASFRFLERLINSLEQYAQKQRNLFYIGFVGHYSSGKSSTINSILNLNGTNDKRETGLNPTDKAITLITHPQNSKSLLLMNREGGRVPIRSNFIESPQLSQIVISDTPGSGDPQVVNEMIQDFLPICDHLLYFISATNPLDQADIPLLVEKAKNLAFIPIKFIVTRTDEFKTEKSADLDQQNLNETKKDIFLGKLISRLNREMPEAQFKEEDFLFIDNESKYQISNLVRYIGQISSDQDSNTKIIVHGNKIEFFRRNLEDCYKVFLDIIEDKIKQSNSFVKTANENIQRFDKSAEINNEKLKLFWAKCANEFDVARQQIEQAIDYIKTLSFPPSILEADKIKHASERISNRIENQVAKYLERIHSDLNQVVKEQLQETRRTIYDSASEDHMFTDNIAHLLPRSFALEYDNDRIQIDFSKLSSLLEDYQQEQSVLVRSLSGAILNRIKKLLQVIDDDKIFVELDNLYTLGHEAISESFNQYFERIQLYRGTVLTRNTKVTIEKLRIGTQLDELDDEFEESFVDEMKGKAIEGIYVNKDESELEFKSQLGELRKQLSAVSLDTDHAASRLKQVRINLSKEDVDVVDLVNNILEARSRSLNIMYQRSRQRAIEAHEIKFNQFQISGKTAKRKRNMVLLKWAGLSGFIVMVAYLLFDPLNYVDASTLTAAILSSLGANLIGGILGYLIGKLKDDSVQLRAESKSKFIKSQYDSLLSHFDASYWEELAKVGTNIKGNDSEAHKILRKYYDQYITEEIQNLDKPNADTYSSLLMHNTSLQKIREQYIEILSEIYSKYAPIFTNVDHNKHLIGAVTAEVKELSIKPSFSLLEETRDNVIQVKNTIVESKII